MHMQNRAAQQLLKQMPKKMPTCQGLVKRILPAGTAADAAACCRCRLYGGAFLHIVHELSNHVITNIHYCAAAAAPDPAGLHSTRKLPGLTLEMHPAVAHGTGGEAI